MTTALYLVLILCAGQSCRTVELPAVAGPVACVTLAPAVAAQVARPGERVASMRCVAGRGV